MSVNNSNARLDASDYEQHCLDAASAQGLDPPKAALRSAGIPVEIWQSGGFTMVLVTQWPGGREVWITDDSAEWEQEYTVGLYDAESLEESTEAIEYHYSKLPELPSLVRWLGTKELPCAAAS